MSNVSIPEMAVAPVVSAPAGAADRRWFAALMLVLGALYGCLYNGYWLPGGSDDVYYLAVARNMARGLGFQWQGVPPLNIPPLWPAVLALAMKITPSMALVQALPLVLTWTAAGVWYWVLRRVVSAPRAFVAMLTAGLLYRWFSGAVHAYSEGLFSLLLGTSLLMALQIREGRRLTWRAPLMVAAACAMVLTRWSGVFAFPLLAGALFSGKMLPALDRATILGAILGIAMAVSYVLPRQWVRHDIAAVAATQPLAAAAVKSEQDRLKRMFEGERQVYIMRGVNAGAWMTAMLWPPETAGMGPVVAHGANIVGWSLLVLLGWLTWQQGRGRQWLWLGAMIYVATHVLILNKPVGRYLAPLAPLLVLGIWQALHLAGRLRYAGSAYVAGGAIVVFFVTTLAANVPVWGISAYVSRSPRFTSLYLAGEYERYLSLWTYLRDRGLQDGQLAIGAGARPRGQASSGARNVRFMQRMTDWFLDRRLSVPPPKLARKLPPRSEALLIWARQQGVRYYLYRPWEQPARAWHLRRPQRSRWRPTTEPVTPAYFELYEVTPGGFQRIELPPASAALDRVPGM